MNFLYIRILLSISLWIFLKVSYAQTIPTVFYLVENTSEQDITNESINTFVQEINNGLSGFISCDSKMSNPNSDIELCLAQRDIFNIPSNGLEVVSSVYNIVDLCTEEYDFKSSIHLPQDRFPTTEYLNIYLVDKICDSCQPIGCYSLGYATLPIMHGSILDGIVVEKKLLEDGCNGIKTFLHELYHYLGLYHTFHNACENESCVIDGDQVCDTPPQHLEFIVNSNGNCNGLAINSCDTDVNLSDPNNEFIIDENDPVFNIMTYGDAACLHNITEDQTDKIINHLNNDRKSLVYSDGCKSPCGDSEFLWQIITPEYGLIDNSILLSASINDYNISWNINGSTFTGNSISFTFQELGNYQIELSAISLDGNCQRDTSFQIEILCIERPEVLMTPENPALGDIITFEVINPDLNLSYNWYFGDSLLSTSDFCDFENNYSGNVSIALEVCSDDCCNTMSYQHVTIGECPLDPSIIKWFTSDYILSINEESEILQTDHNLNILFNEAMVFELDHQENPLFMCNGRNIYNKNFEIMNNSFSLASDVSGTQIVSIKHPGDNNFYYVFYMNTVLYMWQENPPYWNDNTNLYMALIDMSLDNGLGSIIFQDSLILTDVTEKVAITAHCNNVDFWLSTHNGNSSDFYTYPITSNGFINQPVISTVGKFIFGNANKQGEMKFSPQGNFLAQACLQLYDDNLEFIDKGFIEVFKFDNSTGIVYNPIIVTDSLDWNYSVEFSPDESKLYFSGFNQADISVFIEENIQNSINNIFETDHQSSIRLKLAPDNKIYFNTNTISFHVINNPNESVENIGLIQGIHEFPDFSFIHSFGNHVNNHYNHNTPQILGSSRIILCDTPQVYSTRPHCNSLDLDWELKGSSQAILLPNDSIKIVPNKPGVDTLILNRTTACSIYSDTLLINIVECQKDCAIDFIWTKIDTTICEGQQATLQFQTNADSIFLDGIYQENVYSYIDIENSENNDCHTLQLFKGDCDSLIHFCIEVQSALSFNLAVIPSELCYGDSVVFLLPEGINRFLLVDEYQSLLYSALTNEEVVLGPFYSDSSFYLVIQKELGLCEEFYPIEINVFPENVSSLENIKICHGDTIVLNGQILTEPDTYDLLLQDENGCDSIHTVILELIELSEYDTILYRCYNEALYYNENEISEDILFFTDTIQTIVSGCDSVKINFEIETIEPPIVDVIFPNYIIQNEPFIIEFESNWSSTITLINIDAAICLNDSCRSYSVLINQSQYIHFEQSIYNCFHKDSIWIEADEISIPFQELNELYIPNIFNPNSQNGNNYFSVFGSGESKIVLKNLSVFDRWGNEIFNTNKIELNDASTGWNGQCNNQNCSTGVYIYQLEYVDAEGRTIVKMGDVLQL